MKYRKKPVVIDAKQYTGDNVVDMLAWTNHPAVFENNNELHIRTLEGLMHVSATDWVIRGAKGEYYPCRDDIFEATYEQVHDNP